ncbi:hypothetical protein ACA910_020889 [Epithemia clementina (nom. ined.)]
MPPQRRRYKELSNSDRGRAVAMLLGMAKDGHLPRGALAQVARNFGVSRVTIGTLWKRAHSACVYGVINSPEFASRKNERGLKPMYSNAEFAEAVRKIPLSKRKTQRQLASVLSVSQSTLQRQIKKGQLKVHTSALKPYLSEENMVARVSMALSFINQEDPCHFSSMMDIIHVDEKWFYLTREAQRFIIASGEEVPERRVQHKGHITKVVFLCAVARPRFDTYSNAWFDGKLGLWPIGKFVTVVCSSRNRPAGTLVWQNTSVTREVYRDLLINKLIPAIHAKWPLGSTSKIRIQQDGAKAHIEENDSEFRQALDEAGLHDTTIFNQAANSPDTNVNDLGFFRAIQSANDGVAANEAELIQDVQKAFDNYSKDRLNRVWLTLQSCFNSIIECNGGNDYKIEHIGKERLERIGRLPTTLRVTSHACCDIDEDDREALFLAEFDHLGKEQNSNLLYSE